MDLSIQQLKILCLVADEKSFSKAAGKLRLTQSSVSHQIIKLEKDLDGKLFERLHKEVSLTPLGSRVYHSAKEILEKTTILVEGLKADMNDLQGVVNYGMPESCQWTSHYKKIMSLIADYPSIEFNIKIASNSEIIEMVKKGELDFGFMTGEKISPELKYEKFGDEHYSLVANTPDAFRILDKSSNEDVRIVGYKGSEAFFISYFESIGLFDLLKRKLLHPNVKVENMTGAIHAAIEGAGLCVLPTHCISQELHDKKLYAFETNSPPATLPIYFIQHISCKLSRRCETIAELLKKSKRGEI